MAKVICGVCLKPIASANSGKGPSWSMVKIGGAMVAVHHDCYYVEDKEKTSE